MLEKTNGGARRLSSPAIGRLPERPIPRSDRGGRPNLARLIDELEHALAVGRHDQEVRFTRLVLPE